MIKAEEQKENRLKTRDVWDTGEQANTHTVGVLRGERGRHVRRKDRPSPSL